MNDYDVGMSEEEAERKGWKPPPPEMTPEEEAILTLEHQLEKDAKAQLEEKNDWHPHALGIWRDVLVEELDAMPADPLPADWEERRRQLSEGGATSEAIADARLAAGGGPKWLMWCRVKALRWVEDNGRHPYYGEAGKWSWYDAAAMIDDMGDDYSNLPGHVYRSMTGEVEAGHRLYKTGLDAMRALVDRVADMYASGLDPDAEPAGPTDSRSDDAELDDDDDDGPDNADAPDYGVPSGA